MMEDWTKRVENVALPMRYVWTSYAHQLCNSIKYGLGAFSATMEELKEGLGSSDYYLTSSLGVVRSIRKEWRYLLVAFCGMCLFGLTAETTAATLNSFLHHYNMGSAVRITLTTTLENLQPELGVTKYPLLYDYDTWSEVATNSWIKSLWEKVDKLRIGMNLIYDPIPLLRNRDACIMEISVELGI